MSGSTPYQILLPIYDGCNTLDVNGPLDVLCNYALRLKGPDAAYSPFNITTTAKTKTVKAYEFITLQADCLYDQALSDVKAGKYDILLIPGGGNNASNRLVDEKDGILDIIKAFIENDTPRGLHAINHKDPNDPSKDDPLDPNKWLFSVCVGAIPVGASKGFNGLNATTHWAALRSLVSYSEDASAPPNSVTRNRWVDGGYLPPAPGKKVPTRVLSSGGISCGLDASLYLVSQLLGLGAAYSVAQMMDYNWNVDYTTKPQTLWYTDPLLPDGIQQPFASVKMPGKSPDPESCTDWWSQRMTNSR